MTGSSGLLDHTPANGRLLAHYSRAKRKRNELAMTDTELKLIAAAAMIGLSSNPKAG